ALEAPVCELPPEVVALLALVGGLAGSLDGQGLIRHGDVDVFRIDPRQGDANAERAVLAVTLHRRPPRRGLLPVVEPGGPPGVAEEPVEHVVHLPMKRQWRPSCET